MALTLLLLELAPPLPQLLPAPAARDLPYILRDLEAGWVSESPAFDFHPENIHLGECWEILTK